MISPNGDTKAPPELRQKLREEQQKPQAQKNIKRIKGLQNAINQIENQEMKVKNQGRERASQKDCRPDWKSEAASLRFIDG